MIVTHETTYEPKVGVSNLTAVEKIHLADKRIDMLHGRKEEIEENLQPLLDELHHVNNLLNHWHKLRLVELYHNQKVEECKPKNAKRSYTRKPKPMSEEAFITALGKMSEEEKDKLITKLRKVER